MKYILMLFLAGCTQLNTALLQVEKLTSISSSDISLVETKVNPALVLSCENKGCKDYSKFIIEDVQNNYVEYLKASDINVFCPKFLSLDKSQKTNVLSEIIVGIIFHESGFNRLSRMVETTMGIDPLTGMQVASEGLLQLSYQDVLSYKNKIKVCRIDYKKDKPLDLINKKHPDKTILNAEINLECGLNILKYQISKYGLITMEKNVYWAVIKRGGKYTQIKDISKRVQLNVKACN